MARVVLAGLLGTALAAPLTGVTPRPALAAGSTVFDQPFKNNTPDSAYPVNLPALPAGATGTNTACLTARNNPTGPGLHSCATNTDAEGTGTLRLTNTSTFQEGGLFGATGAPTSQGLDVTFNSYQYGGSSADGIAFVAAAVDPASPVPPTNIGQPGGALGYSTTKQGNLPGLANSYLGVGLDVFGNYSNSVYEGSTCTDPPYISTTGGRVPGQVVVRGPGSGTAGYCAVNSTAATVSSPALALHGSGNNRSNARVPVEVVINPTTASFVTASGLTVAAGTYQVVFTPIGGSPRTLTGTLPTVSPSLYPSPTWLNANGIPRQLAFGWVGSTGGSTDYHEIDNAKVVTFSPVPDLSVSQTSFNGSAPQPGDPVTYTVVPKVGASGSNETSPVSVTETMPAGVVPAGAFGSGWVCAAPVGQKVTCTNSNTPFPAGTSLPPITVVGIVTGSSVTPALIQSSSTATASSIDANPGISTSTTVGTVPPAPSGITVTPATSTIAGGIPVTVSGSNVIGANAIEIGTTAEQQAGTPVVLLPCQSGPAAGCFTDNGNGTLSISSMPPRTSAASVSVTVVSDGIAGSTGYVYTSAPGTPATPTATAGVTSATVSWVAPAANGSPITGYIVTPYLNGVAQSPQSFNASTTTRTFSGLTAGGSYRFTVAAVNAIGTGAASPQSAAVIPYTVPGQPVITAAVAGDASATLTWTAPANGGSPITGYVITPYIGAVAQTPQTFTGTGTTQTATGLTPGTAYTFTVTAQNLAGPGPPSAHSAAVTPNASPTLNFPPPPGGEVGVAYSDQLTVSGGTAPFAWSVSAGSLPPGLSLNASTGLLSGTPTTAGGYSFTVRISDASGQSDTRPVTLVIVASPTLTFPPPPAGQVGVAYSDQLTVSGGTAPFAWSVSAGSLPPGLSLDASTGLLSGTPTTAGSFAFTVRVVDANGRSDTRAATMAVGGGPIVITKTADTTAAPPGSVVHYTVTVRNTGTGTFNGISLTDGLSGVLDDATYDNDLTATSGTASFTNPNVTWSGDLAAGAVATITYSVTVGPPGSGDGHLTNTVTSGTLGANCAAGSGDASCTVNVDLLALTIVKTADAATATPGQTVNYSVKVTNSGHATYSGAAFTDALAGVLDDATYNADATATSGTVSYAAPVLSWSGNLAAGGSATITYSVTVNSPDAGDKSLTNTVSSASAGSNCPAGGIDPRCTVTVTTLIPQLTINSVADVSTTVPTGVVRYTATVTNTGQTPYTGATFTVGFTSPPGNASYNNDFTVSSGSLTTNPDGTVTWTGDLAVGASMTATGSVVVNNPPVTNILSTAITSTTPGNNCPAGGSDPGCFTTVTIQNPQLTITKTADVATVNPGGTVTYTITAANTGPTAYTGAAFTDSLSGVLPDAVYNNDASATSGTVSYADPALSWVGDLAVGATATITYSVTIKDPDLAGKLPANTVVSSTLGNNCPAGGTDPACTARVVVLVPALTITKTAGAPTVVAGGTVTYTVSVANTGQTPYTGASFTDSLSGVLDDGVYNNDASATSGTVSYSAPTLSWNGDLAVGATATITYTVTVNSPDAGNGILANTVVSPTTGNNCPSGGTDARCTVAVRVSQLLLQQSYAESSTTPGSVVHLTATFTNTGQVPYTGISVAASTAGTVDDAIPNGDQVASSGSLTLTATNITWTGDIPVGGVVTITGTLTVRNPDPGNKIITGTLVSSAPGNNCPSGSSDPLCTATVNVLLPALSFTKTADVATQVPGGVVNYTIVIDNTGQTPYTGATATDNLAGVLTDATYNSDASATSGTIAFASGVGTWTGDLPVGASATITYSVTINDPDTGGKSLINSVVSDEVGSTCPANSGNPACTATAAVLTPALTIVKTAGQPNVNEGSTLTYTVTVTNSGQVAYTGATFADDLTGVLDDGAYNNDASATAGTVSYTSPVLTWSGDLAVGAAATITYTVTAANPALGDHSLVNTITSTTSGSNCPSGGSDTRCAATVPVTDNTQLTFTKTAGAATATRGAVVSYTITIANSAASPYLGATFTDPLSGVLDDAVYDNNVSATSGTVGYSAPNLTWSGNVPATGSVTVTYSVTVNTAKTGDDRLVNTLTSTSPGSNCLAASTDPRCAATVTVSQLTIVGSSDVATTTPGGAVTLTTTITNAGQTPYNGISVGFSGSDLLDDATPNGTDTATSGTLTVGPTGLTWSGNIAPGDTVTVTSSFTVNNPDTGSRHIVATATSETQGSNCLTGSTDPQCSITVDVLVPALTISKSANTSFTVPGATVGYTITVHNTGETPYTGISVTDPLTGVIDEATYNNNASATGGAVSYSTPTLTWTGDVAVGATVTITYSVTVDNPVSGGKLLSNTVSSTATGSTCSPTAGTAACTATVAILTPALTLTKVASSATTTPGATVTYTITATNTGQTAYAAASLTDPLSGVLDDAAFNNDASATSGTVGYTAPTLTWTGALNPGASATITYSITLADPGTGNKILTNTLSSATAGNNCPTGGTDPRCAATVAVSAMTIAVGSDVSTTIPTGVVHFTATFTNTGQVPLAGANASFALTSLPGTVTYNNDFVVSSGSLDINPNGTIVWTGDLPVGATVTATGSVTVDNPPASASIASNVTSTTPGSNCPVGGTDPACSIDVPIQIPQLTIAKTADSATTTPGSTVTYTVTVANTGPTAYSGATFTDTLSGVLGDADYNGDATASSGALTYASPALTWTGDVPIAGTVTITYSVTVKSPDPGDKLMANTVTSTTLNNNCPAGGTDSACGVLVVVLVPQLTITKTADAPEIVAGGTVHYTVALANTGQTPYTAAGLTDSLADVLDDATYNNDASATSGTVAYSAPTLSWTGDLAVAATATITYSVTAANPGTGDHVLANTATSTATGSTCPAGTTLSACVSTVNVTAQSITLSDVTSAFTLTGGVNSAPRQDNAVTMTVVTNSPSGYDVTARGTSPSLTSAETGANIPIANLQVREHGTGVFQPLSAITSVITHAQSTPSAQNGDPLSNDYQADIPFVPSGRYSTTIDYIATTQ